MSKASITGDSVTLLLNSLPQTPLETPSRTWDDARLVGACLRGDDRAWTALVSKYERLIFSILIKRGATRDDAADIFQAVCLELFSQLPHLRKTEALRGWLMTITVNKHYRWRQQRRREDETVTVDVSESDVEDAVAIVPPDLLAEIEDEQTVREAVAAQPERCRELIRLLFYEHPAVPYVEVARRLGLAVGSIGFIRGRCLERLERTLRKAGLR
jgi:RNA polymerase sigma factor (sigma-70 family)